MPNINLIAARRQEKRRMEKLTRQLFFALSRTVAGFVAVTSYFITQRFALVGDMAEADTRMSKLQPKLLEIDRIKKETAEKQPKVETLEKARYETLRWTMLFQSVSLSLPPDVWLTSLGAPEGDAIVVTLAGSAPSQIVAAQVVQNLLKQPLFDQVEIPSVNRNDLDKRVMFQILAHIRPLEIPKPPEPPAEKKTAQAGKQKGESRRV